MRARSPLALAALACAGIACADAIDALDPMVGEQRKVRCVNEDSDRATDVSFSKQILPIFTGEAGPIGCGCHQPTGANPIGLEEARLDLSSYSGLRAGGINSGARAIVAGSPCESILWQKITAGPPFGARMPLSGPPFLDADTRRLIADWIAEGARDN